MGVDCYKKSAYSITAPFSVIMAKRPAFTESDLIVPYNPLLQLQKWLDEEKDATDSVLMSLSTVSSNSIPSCRYLNFCGLRENGIPFYTDSKSRKVREFTANPTVALTIYIQPLVRQIRIEGTVMELSKEVAAEYFNALSREQQITLMVANQDRPIVSREAMLRKRKEIAQKYSDPSLCIPLPENWRAYVVLPDVVEFFQGHTDWLADRFIFAKEDDEWVANRLLP